MSNRRMAKLIALAAGAAVMGTALVHFTRGEDALAYPMLSTMPHAASADTPHVAPSYVPASLRASGTAGAAAEDAAFDRAARAAWAFIERHDSPETGLVSAQPSWAYPTVWDIASTIGAYYSARGLGYIDDADYRRRVSALLRTMTSARMYKDLAYGRNYDFRTGELVGHDQQPTEDGTGYSALDQGRF